MYFANVYPNSMTFLNYLPHFGITLVILYSGDLQSPWEMIPRST